MLTKNFIFYNNKRIFTLDNKKFILDIQGENNTLYLEDFYGPGILEIKIPGNQNTFKMGKNNKINTSLRVDFHSTEDGNPEKCSILIGDRNEFNGEVIIISSFEPNAIISIGNNNLFANRVSIRGPAYHLIFDTNTMQQQNVEKGISIGSQNWICDDVIFLNKARLGNNCVVGTRSLVNRDFLHETNSIIAGDPACIKKRGIMWNRSKQFFEQELSSYQKTKVEIPVFLIASDDIVAPMTVTMCSILANTDSFVHFYVLERSNLEITPENRNKIKKLRAQFPHFAVDYIPLNPDDFKDLAPTTSKYIPNDTYFRYVIPEIKPEIKKAIYLDVDIIVRGDIKNLYKEPLKGCLLGGVNHPKYCWNYPYNKKVMDNLNLKNKNVYINGGVLVFDCEKCRKQKITEKLFKTTRELKDTLIWADQDVFNLVFQDSLKILPEKYNALRSVYENEKITDPAIIDSIEIIHFNGAEKPWNNLPYLNEEFWKYAQLTDFSSDLQISLDKSIREKVYGQDKHISFLLRKIHEYTVDGCKGLQDKHIPFILGRIKEYDNILNNKQSFKTEAECVNVKILGIPVFKIETLQHKKKYFIFSKIPLLKITYKPEKQKYLLFNFLTILKIIKKPTKSKYLLFSFIPLCKMNKQKIDEIKKNHIFFEKNKLNFHKDKKIKIYFLYHSDAFWPSWKTLWDACRTDKRIETKMIYCPVKNQNIGFEGQFLQAEEFLKFKNIPFINVSDWDIKQDQPHILIIQTPYDEYHRFPKYWSQEFKKKGIRVVYVSYGLEFTETELSKKNHFALPIYKNAWKIYSFAEFLKKDYKKYGHICDGIVESVGHPKFDMLSLPQSSKEVERIKKSAEGKKIVLWHPHFPCNYSTVNGETACSTFSWEDNKKLLNYLKKRKDIFCVFMPHHLFFGVFENQFKVPREEIETFKKTLTNSKNMCLWTGEYPPMLDIADILLGERSAVTMEMISKNKPILYLEQHPEIYNEFGKNVLDACYYVENSDKAIKELKFVLSGKDNKMEQRQLVFDKYFKKFFDGKCGERIKDNLVTSLKTDKT